MTESIPRCYEQKHPTVRTAYYPLRPFDGLRAGPGSARLRRLRRQAAVLKQVDFPFSTRSRALFSRRVNIRAATHDDLPGILEIYNDAVLNTTATYDYAPRTLEHRVAWFDDHQKTNYPVFVAVDPNNRVLGWSSLNRYHDRMGYRFTTENSVYVRADQRGKGIGKSLLAPLITVAHSRGWHAIMAVIDADNAVSIRLHASFGFEQVGLFKEIGFKFDRWLSVVYMELILRGSGLAESRNLPEP